MVKTKKSNSIATALIYAVTYINLRDFDGEDSDDDVGALESIAGFLANCTAEELDQLSLAAKDAFNAEQRTANRQDFLDDYGKWMEEMFGEEWEGNERQVEQ